MGTDGQFSVPRHIAEITPDWLTGILSARYPGTVVTSVFLGTEIHGTSTKTRLLLSYNDAGHHHRLPPTMWLKNGFEAHSDTHDMLLVYAAEAHFYLEIAGLLENNIPTAYAASVEAGTGRSFLLLEDLLSRNALFRDATEPVSVMIATQLISELARLHARTWNAQDLKTRPWLQGGGSLLQSCDIMMSRENWERSLNLPRGQFVRGRLRDFQTIRSGILTVLQSDVDNATCFVHGDSHVGNAFFPAEGAPGFLDWQSVFYGMWAHDVAYFIVTGLSIEDRRHHERQLIAHYVDEMAACGRPMSFDAAWLEYRRHAFYSCSWSMCLPEWQEEARCCAVTEKAFAAIEDLGTLEAW
ncbi:MAG: aminoglycoside phosphotransferase family protein [Sphingobium sp.]